jgi:hypothetical protein
VAVSAVILPSGLPAAIGGPLLWVSA